MERENDLYVMALHCLRKSVKLLSFSGSLSCSMISDDIATRLDAQITVKIQNKTGGLTRMAA